jgi:NitT/TauT family transport system substrate-binding protein
VVILVAACSGTVSSTPAAQPTAGATGISPASERPTVSLKFGTSSAVDFDDVPVFAAFEALNAQGIDIDVLPLATNTAALTALANGQVDFGVARPEAVQRANKAGANLRIFFGRGKSDFVMVAPVSITAVEQLDGKRVAYHAPGEITYALATYAATARNIKPEFLVVPGSEARVAGLMAGEIDASPVDLASWLTLNRERPGEFHILVDFNEELPDTITTSHIAAPLNKLEEDPALWRTIADELMKNLNLAASDPEWLADQAVKYLPGVDRAEMVETAKAYGPTFDTTGGVDETQLTKMIDFFVEYEIMKPEEALPFDEYASRIALDQ